MNRTTGLTRPCLLLIAAATVATVQAQEPAADAASKGELQSLRHAVEQQSKQIEALTQQITELNRRLPASKEPPREPAPVAHVPAPVPPPEPPPAPPAVANSTPPAPAPAAPPSPAPSADGPKTDAAAGGTGVKHTVAKGETLTSIAKRYNIPLAEIEKANKIENDRKLQIGQVLNIPTTANKTPEPPTDKKENP